MKPVVIPIDGELDLHTFPPGEVASLVDEYLAECARQGIFSVRVIHGKGTGMLKKKVWSVLSRHPLVQSFQEAPPAAGGWGATLVTLVRPAD
ncbi:MAG: Smr/MutS family protein [Desulfosudaceae bacterium]